MLTLKLSKGVEIVGFADDVVLTLTGEMLEEVEMLETDSIETVGNLIQGAKLQIALHITDVLLVSNCKAV